MLKNMKIPLEVIDKAKNRMQELYIKTFTAYVIRLILTDSQKKVLK
jgi:hypothetical protein